jgi:hypothetical protein
MARNPIQFDKGLSLTEFRKNYGTEEQCRRAVVALRWPSGAEAAMKGASGGGMSDIEARCPVSALRE